MVVLLLMPTSTGQGLSYRADRASNLDADPGVIERLVNVFVFSATRLPWIFQERLEALKL